MATSSGFLNDMNNKTADQLAGSTAPSFRAQVGSRLRALEKKFANRAAAAKAAGVAKSTLQSWVEGKADPSFEGLTRLAAAAGVSIEWLATGNMPGSARPENLATTDSSDFRNPNPVVMDYHILRLTLAGYLRGAYGEPHPYEAADKLIDLHDTLRDLRDDLARRGALTDENWLHILRVGGIGSGA
jgi:transcriptional regulator with XRE-family HTH domain